MTHHIIPSPYEFPITAKRNILGTAQNSQTEQPVDLPQIRTLIYYFVGNRYGEDGGNLKKKNLSISI